MKINGRDSSPDNHQVVGLNSSRCSTFFFILSFWISLLCVLKRVPQRGAYDFTKKRCLAAQHVANQDYWALNQPQKFLGVKRRWSSRSTRCWRCIRKRGPTSWTSATHPSLAKRWDEKSLNDKQSCFLSGNREQVLLNFPGFLLRGTFFVVRQKKKKLSFLLNKISLEK